MAEVGFKYARVHHNLINIRVKGRQYYYGISRWWKILQYHKKPTSNIVTVIIKSMERYEIISSNENYGIKVAWMKVSTILIITVDECIKRK